MKVPPSWPYFELLNTSTFNVAELGVLIRVKFTSNPTDLGVKRSIVEVHRKNLLFGSC